MNQQTEDFFRKNLDILIECPEIYDAFKGMDDFSNMLKIDPEFLKELTDGTSQSPE